MSVAGLFGPDERPQSFPPMGGGAFVIALTFKRLGGWFCIDSRGTRGVGQPCCAWEEAIPQLPEAEPHEQFYCESEWLGAVKVPSALIHRLDKDDKDAIFDLLAIIAVDERQFTPSIEEPKRRAA